MRGKQLKEIINSYIKDDDLVCIGESGDKMGRYDQKIIGIETRPIGFEGSDTYKAIITESYHSNGAMKFWS